jgi:hypothetical protein
LSGGAKPASHHASPPYPRKEITTFTLEQSTNISGKSANYKPVSWRKNCVDNHILEKVGETFRGSVCEGNQLVIS